MSLWYAQRRTDTHNGKFQKQSFGSYQRPASGSHLGWTYEFVRYRAAAGVRTASYSVTIYDRDGERAHYLTDFPSLDRAAAAARHWIDKQVA